MELTKKETDAVLYAMRYYFDMSTRSVEELAILANAAEKINKHHKITREMVSDFIFEKTNVTKL